MLDSAATRCFRPLMGEGDFIHSPHRERQGMQLVSSGYNPVLMQKGMKASDSRAGPLLLDRAGVMINQSMKIP